MSNLLPASAQNLGLNIEAEEYNETFVSSSSANGELSSAYAALDQALMGRATMITSGDIDLSGLTAAQRSLVVEHIRAIAESAHVVMRQLLAYQTSMNSSSPRLWISSIRRKRGTGTCRFARK